MTESFYIYEDREYGYNILLNEPCGPSTYIIDKMLDVPRFHDIDIPGSRKGSLPIFFRNPLPFLLPPDKFSIIGNRVEILWSGKEVGFLSEFIDHNGRLYESIEHRVYNTPPAVVTIDMFCREFDQFLMQIVLGNKSFSLNFIKLPYLSAIVLHPANIIKEGKYSTDNQEIASLNRSVYSIYDLLLILYKWGNTSFEIDISGDSIYERALADMPNAHNILSLNCSTCLPDNPYPDAISIADVYFSQLTMISPWIYDLPLGEILVGITILSLGGVITPLGGIFAFKPKSGYWVIIQNVPGTTEWYGYIMITANCGDGFAHLFVRYGSSWTPSPECIDVVLLPPPTENEYWTRSDSSDVYCGTVTRTWVTFKKGGQDGPAGYSPGGTIPGLPDNAVTGSYTHEVFNGFHAHAYGCSDEPLNITRTIRSWVTDDGESFYEDVEI